MSKGIDTPILLDFPEQIETERLILRPPKPGDGPAMNAATRESLDDLRPWMPWAQHVPEVEETEAICRRKYAEWITREDLMITFWRKSDGEFVGGSGMHRINWAVPQVEIGYWRRSSMTGNGYVTETVNALTAFAFKYLHAQRIEIRIDSRNTASIAVAERAAYMLEAQLTNHDRAVDGSLRDTLVYVMFPPDAQQSS